VLLVQRCVCVQRRLAVNAHVKLEVTHLHGSTGTLFGRLMCLNCQQGLCLCQASIYQLYFVQCFLEALYLNGIWAHGQLRSVTTSHEAHHTCTVSTAVTHTAK